MRMQLDTLLTLVLAFVMTLAMLWPGTPSPPNPLGFDKALHAAGFLTLVIPLSWCDRLPWPAIFFGALAFGGAIELIQPLMGRTAEWLDWFADGAGAAAGILLSRALSRNTT